MLLPQWQSSAEKQPRLDTNSNSPILDHCAFYTQTEAVVYHTGGSRTGRLRLRIWRCCDMCIQCRFAALSFVIHPQFLDSGLQVIDKGLIS